MATQGAIVVDKERCKGCGATAPPAPLPSPMRSTAEVTTSFLWSIPRNASAAPTARPYALIQLSLFIVLKSKF